MKSLPSQGLHIPGPFASRWGHMVSSQRWNATGIGVCHWPSLHSHTHWSNCQHLHFFSGRLCPPGLALPTHTSRLEMPGNYHPLANSFKQMIDNMDVNPSSSSFKWEDSETCNLHWVPEFPQQDQPLVAHSGTLLDNILFLCFLPFFTSSIALPAFKPMSQSQILDNAN